ncbi:MAG: ASCH domain-containing protein [Planctomycetes bacterium]|nr:ASCH domain-containing protein [Planctomycetota bacterium]
MLLMKKQFFEAIRCGRKTMTLRFWTHCRVKPGSTHRVPGLGAVRIESVEETALEDLTESDAIEDGFECRADLRRQIRLLYPAGERSGRKLFKVRFQLVRTP